METNLNYFSRRRLLQGAAALGAVGTISIVGCGEDNAASTPTPSGTTGATGTGTSAPTSAPTSGGTVTLAATDIPHFDWQVTFTVLQTLYANRLLRFKTGGDVESNHHEVVRDIAVSWETPEPDHVILKLDPAAKFHDKPPVNGRALTSEDVKATLELLRTEKPNYVYRYLSDFIGTIAAPDPSTVELKLDYPTGLIWNALAYYNSAIAPKETIEADGNLNNAQIGTGPFVLDQYEKGVNFAFSRNPSYFRGRALLDKIDLNVIADSNTRLDALRANRLDAMDVPFALRESALSTLDTESFTEKTVPGIGWSAFWFNPTKAPFDDLRVRQAFGLAIDRTAANNLVAQGKAEIRTGPLARGWSNWARPADEISKGGTRDVERAKQLLSAAGFADGFDVEWVYGPYPGDPGYTVRSAEVAQQYVKEAGITLKITTLENAAWLDQIYNHNFTLSTWAIRAYPDPDDYLYPFFYPGGAKNFGQTDDATLTDLILKQRQAVNPDERKTILQDIDRRWTEEFAYATWDIEIPFTHIFNNRLQNYAPRNPTDYAGLAEASVSA